MSKGCFRGFAAACLVAGLCLPAAAQGTTSSSGRQFTQSEHLMHHVIASHFGLTHQQVMDLHGKGYTYEEIATAANIASRSGRPLSDVVALRDQRMEWPAIASQYGVAQSDLATTSRVMGARSTMSGPSNYAMPNTNIDWSRRYELTPLEMKRLRAKGLDDDEIYVVANAARYSGRDVDEFVQRVFRGSTTEMIAMELNLSPSLLEDARPEWKTPEWEQAVREGAWYVPAGRMPGTTGGTMR
jgi:hypothetical protein